MSTHSRLAPSARYRWQLCPGSVAACALYEGDGSSSPATIDGTHSHTLLEHCIKNDQSAKSYFGMVLVAQPCQCFARSRVSQHTVGAKQGRAYAHAAKWG